MIKPVMCHSIKKIESIPHNAAIPINGIVRAHHLINSTRASFGIFKIEANVKKTLFVLKNI